MVMEATFDIRRPTTMTRHSTAGIRRLRERRHSTFNSRRSSVGCRPAVDRRMSNVVCYSFSDATKGTFTAQEVAPKDMTVAPKTNCVAPKLAPKTSEVAPKEGCVAPKGDEVAPKNAPKNAVKPSGDAVKNAETAQENATTTQETSVTTQEVAATTQENASGMTDLVLALIKETPEISLTEIAEKLGISRDGVKYHVNKLKKSIGLIHDGPTKKGRWIIVNQ